MSACRARKTLTPLTKDHFTHETESSWPLHLKRSHWRKRRSRSKFGWGTNEVCECKMNVMSTWISTWHHWNGSYFMVTWTIFKNHLLEIGTTQNRKTMALQTPTTDDLFYFIMCEDPHEYSIWLRAWSHMASHYRTLGGSWPHYMILEVLGDRLWTLSFGLSQFHGHGSSWLMCKAEPNIFLRISLALVWSGPNMLEAPFLLQQFYYRI